MLTTRFLSQMFHFVAVTCLFVFVSGQEDIAAVEEITLSNWQQAYNENQRQLVLLYRNEGCNLCPGALEMMTQILGQPEIPTDVGITKSSDAALSARIGVADFPALLYLRDKSVVRYDGNFELEDILEWTQLAGSKATQRLDDTSFEHLTQASTGATTGDWLVAFYKDSCQNVLTLLETLGVRLRGRINVAKVNTEDSPALVDRFKVTDCPHIIFFKQGKLYRYELPTLDVASLRSFVDGFYKNVRAEPVPVQKSQFDIVTEKIADYIKNQLEGENRTVALSVLCGVAVSFILIFLCCCRSMVSGDKKEKKE